MLLFCFGRLKAILLATLLGIGGKEAPVIIYI